MEPAADSSDQIPVYVKAVDENGTVVPDFKGEVHLDVSGEGELIGKEIPRVKIEDQVLENGVGSALVRTTQTAGDIVITASAEGLEEGTNTVVSRPCTDTFVADGEHTPWIGGVEKLEEEQLDNLAAGKTAKASSEQTGNTAVNGTDDDDSTRWCASGGSFPQWYQIDLEKTYAISGFQILWEKADAISRYVIQVSNDGVTWTDAVDLSENEKANGSTDTRMVRTEGRYVRINIESMSDGWASFYEFRVFEDTERGEIDPGDTIPDEMVKSITATGGEVEGRGTDKLRDGVTGIGTGWLSASREFPQTVTLEFTEPQNLIGSRIYWEKDSSWYTYDLEVSADGENWNKVIDSITVGGQHYKPETFKELQKNITFARITIQNVDAGGDYNIGMAEWILYGTPAKAVKQKEFDYASDLEWESAHTDYGSVVKDESAYGGAQILHTRKGDRTFAKGLGTDTNSEIIYQVEDAGYSWFDSYIGINARASKQGGEAIFKIYKDEELVYTSPVKMRDDICEHVSVNIEGASEIRLVTEWNDNPENPEARYNTHTNWSDARFYSKNSVRGELRRLYELEDSEAREEKAYTRASFGAYTEVLEQIPAVLEDEEAEDAYLKEKTKELQEAVSQLRKLTDLTPDELLEEILSQAEEIRQQAEEARQAAEQAREEAKQAEDAAKQASEDAENARKEAEEARKRAEELLKEMQIQKEAAQKARDEAEKAKQEILSEKAKQNRPKKVSLKAVKASGKGKVTVTWKKQKGVSGYEICYSANRKFKNSRIKKAGAKSSTARISKLKSKKTCYVRVRSYKKLGDTVQYGAYSKAKRIRVK